MKKILALTLLLTAVMGLSAQQTSIIEELFKNSVEEKVSGMQELIGFNDDQAQQLKKIEFDFLVEVNKVENSRKRNKQKRIEKLKIQRDTELQNILERHQYIQYDAIENNKIKKRPLWSN